MKRAIEWPVGWQWLRQAAGKEVINIQKEAGSRKQNNRNRDNWQQRLNTTVKFGGLGQQRVFRTATILMHREAGKKKCV